GGFILWSGGPRDRPWEEGAFSATVSDSAVQVNHAWFRGGWWDALTMAWTEIAEGASYQRPPIAEGAASPGAPLFVPVQLAPGASKTIPLRLAWFVGQTNRGMGKDLAGATAEQTKTPLANHRPWYAGRFADINAASFYWRDHYEELRRKTKCFSDCFHDTTL